MLFVVPRGRLCVRQSKGKWHVLLRHRGDGNDNNQAMRRTICLVVLKAGCCAAPIIITQGDESSVVRQRSPVTLELAAVSNAAGI
jgi:hypothetical protein